MLVTVMNFEDFNKSRKRLIATLLQTIILDSHHSIFALRFYRKANFVVNNFLELDHPYI